ncbi:leukemia inhibitory factor [Pseudophryne corroboree]|uniref:leukemia inhibitory factor n=1 Tax=Pseudophryne corroboree TaxID=495146 RepID=UPI0030820A33
MKLVAGIVQLLIFQQCALVMGRAKPLNAEYPLCANVSNCNNNMTVIMTQIKLKINEMHSEAKCLFDSYVKNQQFDKYNLTSVCNPESIDFPKFNVANASEEEKMVELYKIFQYMKVAMGNISQEQSELNPLQHHLLSKLNTSKAQIAAVIYNLSCILCRKYQITKVDVHYSMRFPTNTFKKKIRGCKILKKYKHFLLEAANMMNGWIKNLGHNPDPSFNKHRCESGSL